jgi:hypothetical protein
MLLQSAARIESATGTQQAVGQQNPTAAGSIGEEEDAASKETV